MKKNEMQFSKIIEDDIQDEKITGDVSSNEYEKINDDNPKKFRKLKGISLALVILPAIIAAIIVGTSYMAVKKANTFTLDADAYQHYEVKISFHEGTELEKKENGDVVINAGGQDTIIDSTLPIYYENSMKMTILGYYIYYAPAFPGIKKVDYFTSIETNADGRITAERDGKNVEMNKGFLFDGKNMYIFLNPVVVEINNHQYELPALSYIEAAYLCDVLIFNHETGETILEPSGKEVTVVAGGGDYTLFLMNDSIRYRNGDEALLFSRPDLLDSLVEE